jgi:hypothetical protein
MLSLPFFDQAVPGTSAPAVEITVGGGGESGGFGGLADAAASLLGVGAGAPAWADHLVALRLHQGLAPLVDGAELLIAQTGDAPSAVLGDSCVILMGVRGALQDFFSGQVTAIEQRTDGLRRYGLGNAAYTLARGRLNQTVTNMRVQEVIAFAADTLGVSLQTRVAGSDGSLPRYVLDDSRSLWDHMTRLADLRGLGLWVDGAGELQLADQLEQGDPVRSFTYGEDVLEMHLWERSPHSGAVTLFGGGRVDDGFTLRKQGAPNRGQGGDGTPQRFYRHGALQSQEDLSTGVAAATLRAHRRATAGELLVPGEATLGPGRVVEVLGLPEGGRTYLIQAAEHSFDRQEGWRTRLSLSEAGEVPGLGGLLGGLGGLL